MTRHEKISILNQLQQGRLTMEQLKNDSKNVVWFIENGVYVRGTNPDHTLTESQMKARRNRLGIKESDIIRLEGSLTVIEFDCIEV
jgi:hypothetical protein